ncbi:hypothetical protein HU200_061368 [Digitaria exilis]|uniref:CONSTANS-like protein n=1 Tax=Digitaria exilis TaxID=1010633 RepID=A0A835DY25_9POAL|nr:hypothetical protein HU200_061368 [Digitaria exilis]
MMGSEGSTSPATAACCAVCGGAAAVYCAADAAALCVPCDAAVHAANLLASRHERVPVAAMAAAVAEASGVYDDLFAPDDVDAAASSWPPSAQVHGSPQNGSSSTSFTTSGDSGGAEGGSLFDLLSDVDLAGGGYLPDGVAPVHHGGAPPLWMHPAGMAAWATTTAWSPADAAAAAGVVLPGTGGAVAMVAAAAERVARVQRYREKRKNRRFQKTIRYASRKAYAEARPRIKGRFVKRAAGTTTSDNASDAASKFWLSFSDDARDGDGVRFYVDAAAYGVVPTF